MNEPWLARPDWAARTIPNSLSRLPAIVFAVLFAVAVNAGVVIAAVAAFSSDDPSKPSTTVLLLALAPFAVAAVFLARFAFGFARDAGRFRKLVLKLDTLPGIVGGRLAGAIDLAGAAIGGTDLRIRLACWKRYSDLDTSDRLLWEQIAGVDPGRTGRMIPFLFDIPAGSAATAQIEPGVRIEWELELHDGPRQLVASWDVPVFPAA